MNGTLTLVRPVVGFDHKEKPILGDPLQCCWDECGLYGYNEIQGRGPSDTGEPLIYIFCSERHLDYWKHSARLGNGYLPSGSKHGLYVPQMKPTPMSRLWVPGDMRK